MGSAVGDGGIAHGSALTALAEAAVTGDEPVLAAARAALHAAIGDAGLVDAAGIVGFFSAIDRVADATGVPLEDAKAEQTVEMRAALGIDAFADGRGD
jgi:hypothetical protein